MVAKEHWRKIDFHLDQISCGFVHLLLVILNVSRTREVNLQGAIRSTHEYKLGHHEGSEGLRMWYRLPGIWKLNSIHKALGLRSKLMQYISLGRIHAVETRLCISWKPVSGYCWIFLIPGQQIQNCFLSGNKFYWHKALKTQSGWEILQEKGNLW